MSFMRSFLACILALCVVAGPAAAAEGELRVGIEGDYPPFSEVSKTGELVGYDVDIAQALCEQLNVKCVLVKTAWDDLIPGLETDKLDMVVASMSITEDRKKQVDFTNPYYRNKTQFVAAKNVPFDPSNLAGRKIGTQTGTIAADWLQANAKGAEIKLFSNQDEVFAALASGAIDTILADNFVTWQWMVTPAGEKYEFKGKPILDDDKIAIAIKKGNTALVEKINASLEEITNNGAYQLINDQYFPFNIN